MEVGQQYVDGAEAVAGRDEDVGGTAKGRMIPIVGRTPAQPGVPTANSPRPPRRVQPLPISS
jgi:hypothetical protein